MSVGVWVERVLFFGGAFVASLVWAAVMMAYVRRDSESWVSIHKTLLEAFAAVNERDRENGEKIQRLGEICQEINKNNAKFGNDVIELVAWVGNRMEAKHENRD